MIQSVKSISNNRNENEEKDDDIAPAMSWVFGVEEEERKSC